MKMQNAEMKFIGFDAGDVIATSNGLSFTGLYDGIQGNAKVYVGGELVYDAEKGHSSVDLYSTLSKIYGVKITGDAKIGVEGSGGYSYWLGALLQKEGVLGDAEYRDDSFAKKYNTVFDYYADKDMFIVRAQ